MLSRSYSISRAVRTCRRPSRRLSFSLLARHRDGTGSSSILDATILPWKCSKSGGVLSTTTRLSSCVSRQRTAIATSSRFFSNLCDTEIDKVFLGKETETTELPLIDSPVLREDEKTIFPSFASLDELHPQFRLALSRSGLTQMTEIQAKTWKAAMVGAVDSNSSNDGDNNHNNNNNNNKKDVIARARTGTGKTLAFLLPAVQQIMQRQQQQQQQQQGKEQEGVHTLIVSPTRELAQQIYKETTMLTSTNTSSTSSIRSQVLYGGIPKRQDLALLQERIPEILIATPGRLLDHLASSYITIRDENKPFAEYFSNTQLLVLDEMDRLLDMGFRDDVNAIISFLPSVQSRQTLLFSATIPSGDLLRSMIDLDCVIQQDNYEYIDCINDDDPTTHTNASIQQSYVILPQHRMISGIVELLLDLMDKPNKNNKILVFFPTTSQVSYFSRLFQYGLGRTVLELHSKMPAHARTQTSERFRNATSTTSSTSTVVMFTSDVSARGVDYPDVTHVVQVGAASNRESYIHRLGRTGRAGKQGKGLLVLLEAEMAFLEHDLQGLDISVHDYYQKRLSERPVSLQVESDLLRVAYEMRHGQINAIQSEAEAAYRSLLGYYNNRLRGLNPGSNSNNTGGGSTKETLVELVNAFAHQAGLQELPIVSEKMAKQLGLLGHPRISVHSSSRSWSVGQNQFDVGRGRGLAARRRPPGRNTTK